MRWSVALIAASLVAVVATDGALIALHDKATPYDAQQALTEFRREAAPTSTPQPTVPSAKTPRPSAAGVRSLAHAAASAGVARQSTTAAGVRPTPTPTPTPATSGEVSPGVYSYATSGHEEVDAFGGARHDYPAETAMTYRRAGCGTEDRWQPLQQRYSLNTLCRGPQGLEARTSVQRREFFGQSEEQDLVCAPGLVLVPDHPRPGRTSSGDCRSDDTTVALTAQVVDVSTMTVGGVRVGAIHLRVDGTMTGSTRGTTHREEWFTRDGLLLRAVASTDTDRDTSAGVVHYSETYDIRLESLQPQR